MNLALLGKQPDDKSGAALSAQTGASKIPALRLGDVGQAPEAQPSSDSSNPGAAKPKLGLGLGLGLDLSKA